jgi:hypothetical protein
MATDNGEIVEIGHARPIQIRKSPRLTSEIAAFDCPSTSYQTPVAGSSQLRACCSRDSAIKTEILLIARLTHMAAIWWGILSDAHSVL